MRLGKMALAAVVFGGRFGFRDLNWKAWPRLAVYPGLGITFNRIQKNANTMAVYLLREIESGEVEQVVYAKAKARKFTDASYADIWSLRKHTFFVIVRNPYSRVLSAFLDTFRRREDYQGRYGPYEFTPQGFAAFVDWLAAGGRDQNKHWNLQVDHLFIPIDKYDAVIRFENLKEEMDAFLRSRGLEPPADRLNGPYPAEGQKRTAADAKLREFYTPRVADIVADLYAADFETLGYSREFPVPLEGSAVILPMQPRRNHQSAAE